MFHRTSVHVVRFLICFAVLSTTRFAVAQDIASVVPADTLLYAHISRPRELWQQFENTKLRTSVQSSFFAEAAFRFISSTTDLFCKSLVDHPLDHAVLRYGLEMGIAVAPDSSPGSRDFPTAYILSASRNGAEFRRRILRRIDQMFIERFPEIEMNREEIIGYEVRNYVFSEKRTWSMVIVNDYVVFGNHAAVKWILESKLSLASESRFREMRNAAKLPDGPHIFCYADTIGAATEDNLLLSRGSAMAGVLEIDGELMRDRVIIAGFVQAWPTGESVPCSIGSVFPAGPYLVNQYSLATGRDILLLVDIDHPGPVVGDAFHRTFSGLALVANDGSIEGSPEILAAKLLPDVDPGRALSVFGMERLGNQWRSPTRRAFIREGYLYFGQSQALDLLEKRFAARRSNLTLNDNYTSALVKMSRTSQIYSYMSPEFIGSLSWFEKIGRYGGIFGRLPHAFAVAERTADGVEIRSVSAHGYGIAIVTSNLTALRRIRELEKQND